MKPPHVMSEAVTYSKVSSDITSMIGHTTAFLFRAISFNKGSSHPSVHSQCASRNVIVFPLTSLAPINLSIMFRLMQVQCISEGIFCLNRFVIDICICVRIVHLMHFLHLLYLTRNSFEVLLKAKISLAICEQKTYFLSILHGSQFINNVDLTLP